MDNMQPRPLGLMAAELAAIVEASEDAIISKTLDGRVITWNAAAERIYGYSASEALGQPMTSLVPPNRQNEEVEILEQIRHGKRVEHFETVRIRKDGREIDVSITISPVRDATGQVVGASHIARDITDRKWAEAKLRASETKLRAYLESASQAILTVSPTGVIETANAKAEETFGYPKAEMLGKPLAMLIPERYRTSSAAQLLKDLSNSKPKDFCALRKNGAEFPAEIALSFIPSDEGPLAIAFVNDISERKKLEEQLREAQKLESLGVLAGGVAHDFNNLLTGILGNISLAVEQIPPGHSSRQPLRNAMTAGERAADLVRQLLAYAGKGKYIVEPISISGVVREMCELIQSSLPSNVAIRLELANDLPRVDADASQIRQLVMNLVINGAEAIGADHSGTVTVTTGVQNMNRETIQSQFNPKEEIEPGTYVYFRVRDTGCGMSSDLMARIFEPFFTTKFTGRGLGLAAVQGIVHGHKGAIQVQSEKGKGSTFTVFLPALLQEKAGQ